MKIKPGLLLVNILLFCCLGCGSSPQSGSISIGVIASLTGPAAEQGQAWKNGVVLAQKELEAQGIKVELSIEDDASQSSGAVAAMNSLTRLKKVQAVIGGTWDYLGEAIYPIAFQEKTPILTPSNPTEIIRPESLSNPYVFTNALPVSSSKEALRQFLVRKKIKSLGLIYSVIPWGEVHASMLRDLAKELGIPLFVDEGFPLAAYPGVLSSIALKVKTKEPEILFTTLDAAGLDILVKELDKLKLETLIVNTQHLEDTFKLRPERGMMDRLYAIYPKVSSGQFSAAYQAEFGTTPPFLAAEGYDALKFLALGLKERGTFTRDMDFEYKGIAGSYKLPAPDGKLTSPEAGVFRILDNRLTLTR